MDCWLEDVRNVAEVDVGCGFYLLLLLLLMLLMLLILLMYLVIILLGYNLYRYVGQYSVVFAHLDIMQNAIERVGFVSLTTRPLQHDTHKINIMPNELRC